MGLSRTPKFIVKVVVPGFYCTPMEWRVKSGCNQTGYGRPNSDNLRKFVEQMNASTEPGQPNDHLGVEHKVVLAEIYLNDGRNDMPLAQWRKEL